MEQQQLARRTRAIEEAVWPLGRPDNVFEIPLWQGVCERWVNEVMRPVHVTYLIAEMEKSNRDREDEDSTLHDIDAAIEASGDWEEVVGKLGWIRCSEIIERFEAGDHTDLVCLINLALDGSASKEPADDVRYFWLRRNPTWDGDHLVLKNELIAWEEMTDAWAAQRAIGDKNAEANTGQLPEYVLGSIMWSELHEQMKSTDPEATAEFMGLLTLDALPPDKFVMPEEAFHKCPSAMAAWLTSEWLGEHGFVNLDSDDWSSEEDWVSLGKELDLGGEISRNEISHWYLVSETAGELLRTLGEIVVDVDGSSYLLWGRDQGGQSIHMDGVVTNAIILSGFVDKIPPLGALHRDEYALPKMRFTLGGEEYPFQVFGYSEHRPNRELDDVLINDQYREMGWWVEWGPEFMSEKDGYVRTFRITNRPKPLEQDQTYFALVRSMEGSELKKISIRVVEAGNEEDARKAAIEDEVREDTGEFAGKWERSVSRLVQVCREDAEALRRLVS